MADINIGSVRRSIIDAHVANKMSRKPLVRFSKLQDENKRDALLSKVQALEEEIARDRTRFEVWADFAIAAVGVIDKATGKLKNVRGWVESIARIIWDKKQEQTKQLPTPPEPKKLEPPKRKGGASSGDDDEIPF